MPSNRVSGARLDALVQNAREPVFLLGPDYRIASANRAWEELTGHAAGAVAGARLADRSDTRRLQMAFAVLVLAVAIYTAARAFPALS